MIKKEYLVHIDLFLAFSSLFLFSIFPPDYSALILFLALCVYLIISQRKSFFKHLLLSFFISLIWTLFARHEYSYNIQGMYVFGIRIFTLLSWTLGLFVVYLIYSHLIEFIDQKKTHAKVSLFISIYIPLLIIVETIGYHVFNIKNFEGAYPGLPICDCMHAVWWMKVVYFLMGAIYILSCFILGLENDKETKIIK